MTEEISRPEHAATWGRFVVHRLECPVCLVWDKVLKRDPSLGDLRWDGFCSVGKPLALADHYVRKICGPLTLTKREEEACVVESAHARPTHELFGLFTKLDNLNGLILRLREELVEIGQLLRRRVV